MIKDRFSACYTMLQSLAYEGVKKEWPPKIDDRRAIKDGIKNAKAHDTLCLIDRELYPLVKKMEGLLEDLGYEMPKYGIEIPKTFRKMVEERNKKGG